MTNISISKIESPSVEWIDEPSIVDRSYIDDVPLIPDKTLQAIIAPLIKSEVDALFDFTPPGTWALFQPFPGYTSRIRRLFKGKILSSFEPDLAIEILDNLFEAEDSLSEEEGEKLYTMLYELTNLNQLLETILLRILSSLKP
jgi:hypothetical protein